jgi:hypothetical protein
VDCSGGDVAQVGISEEVAHQVWQLLQPVQRRQRLGFEVVGTGHASTADPVVLDVLPHPLTRVQLRRIPGQEAQPQPPITGGGERLDGLGAMHWMAVQDQEHRAGGVVQQPTAEVDEHRALKLPS